MKCFIIPKSLHQDICFNFLKCALGLWDNTDECDVENWQDMWKHKAGPLNSACFIRLLFCLFLIRQIDDFFLGIARASSFWKQYWHIEDFFGNS